MKLSISRQQLMERLSDIQNIVEKRNTMPVLSHFLLDAGKKGSFITATDIETALREPVEAQVEAEGRLAIPARKLFEIVKEVEGDLSLQSDGQWLGVKAGKSSFRLACLAAEEFPAWPAMEKSLEFQLEPSVLGECIEKTIFSAGESDTRYALNGLLFELKGNTLTVVGTDGHRMAVITKQLEGATGPLAAADGETKVIVPRKTTSELRKFLDRAEKVTVRIGANSVLFKVGPVEFLARLIEGTYPNYGQVIPAGNDKKVLAEREIFIKALKRVSVMSRETSNAVRMDLEAGSVRLSSSNPDLGEAKDEFKAEYSGEPLTLGFNARYLLDVLNAMTTERVSFELRDQLSPTLLKEEGNDAYRCVVMPMRI